MPSPKFQDLKKLVKSPFFIVVVAYLLALVIVNPLGNFAVNDDWIFVRQVEAFSLGNFKISAILDPSFIVQGLLGLAWGKIFGISFVSMRVLTILSTILMLFGVYKILKLFDIPRHITLYTLILVIFNPLVFTSSLTFMTEIFFLLLFVWSVYFYLQRKDILGGLFTALSILVRQVGMVVFIAYFIVSLIDPKRRKPKELFFNASLLVLSLVVLYFWPKHFGDSFLSNLIEPQFLLKRLKMMLFSPHYFVFFTIPLLFSVAPVRKIKKIVKIPLVLILTALIFSVDLFPVGSVFYIEALHAKSGFRSNLSIFDNVFFKLLLSFIISISVLRVFSLFDKKTVKIIRTKFEGVFLGLITLGMFSILFLGSDYYDRYLLPSLMSFILLFAYVFKKRFVQPKNKMLVYSSLMLMIIISIFLQQEFFSNTRLRWKQALALQSDTGNITTISVDGTYAKYFNALHKEDYTGLIRTQPSGNYVCYVQKYTLDTNSPILKVVEFKDDQIQRFISNPKVYGYRKKHGVPKAKNNLDKLLYNEEYNSYLYNLIGKKAYVGSWCIED